MKLELIRSSVKEIIERESGKTLFETELTEYVFRSELDFVGTIVALAGKEAGKLSIIFNEMTETEAETEIPTDTGTYVFPSTSVPENIVSIRTSGDVELRRIEPRLKGRVLGSNDIIKATSTDPVWWVDDLLINTAPTTLGTLDIFFVKIPTKTTAENTDITVPDRYVEAIIKYVEYLAWTSVADLSRAKMALNNYFEIIKSVVGTAEEMK